MTTARKTLAAVLAALALPVSAQQSNDADKKQSIQEAKKPPGLETIIVTANKRVETLEHVPQAISVVTEEMIERANVRDIVDVINLSPALSLTYGTTPANNGINMRGIGTTSIGIGVEADVAYILDDIPMGMQVKAFQDLAEVTRIEILKGPQNTLFGKSAIAGAIYVVTRPASGPMSGKAMAMYTSDKERRYAVSYGGSVTDTWGFRISASDNDFPGNVNNLTTGEKVNGAQSKTAMAKINWRPAPQLDIDLTPRWNKTSTNCCVLVATSFVPIQGALLSNIAQLPASSLLAGITPGPDNRDVRNDAFTGQDSTDKGAGLRMSWSMPSGASLLSITSASHYDANDNRDQDFVDVPTLLYYPLANGRPAGVNAGYTQFGTFKVLSQTQEFRYVSPDAGALRYVAGLWYGHNTIDRHFIRGYNGIALTTPTQYFTDTYNRNTAVFGQATWDFRSDWSALLGMRFNRETSGYHFTTGAPPPAAFVPTGVFSSTGNGENAFTWKASIQNQVNRDLMVYALASTGYKGKAYDLTSSLNAATAAQQPVKSETAGTIEVGAKGNLLDNRLTVNFAAFYTKFHDYQQNSGSYLPGTTTYVTRLNSVGGVQTKGAEADVVWLVARDFVVNAGFAYTDATITEWPNAPCYSVAGSPNGGFNAECRLKDPNYGNQNVQDLAGGRMPNAPRIKVYVSGIYDIRLDGPVDAFVNGSYRYQSDVLTNLNQDPTLAVPTFSITNLAFGIRDKRDRYRVTFGVNNVFDKHYAMTGLTGLGSWNSRPPNPTVNVTTTTWTPARDAFRYYGLRLDLSF